MKMKSTGVMRFALLVALFMALVSNAAFGQVNEALDPKNWESYRKIKEDRIKMDDTITADGSALKLSGFHLGINSQYALKSSVASKFTNKMVTIKMRFDGEFVGADSSFIALGLLGTSAQTEIWNQPCYALLFKSTKIEIQKHGKGTNPNFTIKYSDFPALGFKTFPVGKEVKVSYGIIQEGRTPRWIIKINDVEIFNGLDNKYGQSVKANPNNVFLVGLFATNKEISGNIDSNSSLTITSME